MTGCLNEGVSFYRSDFNKTTKKCGDEIYLKVHYKVDVQRQQVMQTFHAYETGEILGAYFLENCKVIDSINFKCKEKDSTTETGMAWAVSNGKHLVTESISIGTFKKELNYNLDKCWYTGGIFGKNKIQTDD